MSPTARVVAHDFLALGGRLEAGLGLLDPRRKRQPGGLVHGQRRPQGLAPVPGKGCQGVRPGQARQVCFLQHGPAGQVIY